ncbi:MAG: hypothetical protein AAB091_01445, partial [Elusimicrobiota bacterium]
PYFHAPLQSGSDRVLVAMKRWYTTKFYSERLSAARRALGDDVAIYTDFLAGFPTETERDFEDSLNFVGAMGLAGLHIFRFSSRTGTPAAAMAPVYRPKELRERMERALALDAKLRRAFARRFVGRTLTVLFEEAYRDRNYYRARAENFLEVLVPAAAKEHDWRAVEAGAVVQDGRTPFLVAETREG